MEENPIVNFEDQLAQLLGTLEIHINCCEIILDYIDSYKSKQNTLSFNKFYNTPIANYLKTICNGHFSEAVSILTSLFHYKNKKEISFLNVEENLKPEVLSELQNLRDEFKSLGFLKFRQTIADHKNKNIFLNPLYLNLTFTSRTSLQELKNIFLKLNKLAFANLDLTGFANVSVTQQGLKKILNQIDILYGEEKSID